MITTAVISFREFLEAFLIVGVFLGISKKLNLKKEFEIGFILASMFGILMFFTYIKFPIKKILEATKYGIVLLGTMMIINGIIKLFFS